MMSRRQAIDKGVSQPCGLKGSPLLILFPEGERQIGVMVVDGIDQCPVIGILGINKMPWLIPGGAFALNRIRTIITLEIENTVLSRKKAVAWRYIREVAMGNAPISSDDQTFSAISPSSRRSSRYESTTFCNRESVPKQLRDEYSAQTHPVKIVRVT